MATALATWVSFCIDAIDSPGVHTDARTRERRAPGAAKTALVVRWALERPRSSRRGEVGNTGRNAGDKIR